MSVLFSRGVLAGALLAMTMGAGAQAGDAVRGRELFVKVGCYSCHGYNGQGATSGPKLAPDPLPAEAISRFIRNSMATKMPPYSQATLSDDDIGDIQAWLASQPKAADWKSIPLLQP